MDPWWATTLDVHGGYWGLVFFVIACDAVWFSLLSSWVCRTPPMPWLSLVLFLLFPSCLCFALFFCKKNAGHPTPPDHRGERLQVHDDDGDCFLCHEDVQSLPQD